MALPLIIKGEEKGGQTAGRGVFAGFGLEEPGSQEASAQLSGGMRQRAALLDLSFSGAAALLDEPFSALDMLTKQSVHKWYLDDGAHPPSTLFITHDIDEAVLCLTGYTKDRKAGHHNRGNVVKEPKPRARDFQVTDVFLDYKKTIEPSEEVLDDEV